MKILTFLTDFGTKSSYVSQMKAVALSITDTKIVDITHDIKPQNVKEAAFVLKSVVPFFPSGTVHVVVVDPGVGTKRRGIVITTPSQVLVGPDNGVLLPAARSLGQFRVYQIKNNDLMLKNVSNTFHGRDIFNPVAARILNGLLFEEIGPIINNYKTLDFEKPEINEKTANGKIIYVDSFGNLVTNMRYNEIRKYIDFNKKIMVFIGKKRYDIPFVKSYGHTKPEDLLATIGSSGFLEISINQGNAKKKLNVEEDESVKILFF